MEDAGAGDPLLDIAKKDYYAIRDSVPKREGFLTGTDPYPRAGKSASTYTGSTTPSSFGTGSLLSETTS